MPIATPPELIPRYGNDPDHFRNVLTHLLIPAVEEAQMEPIPPSSEASEIIHADIISKLAATDVVLCDISSLNANVFFELGVRTSLNKPVCLIKDDQTPQMPFDTLPIQCETYRSALTIMTHSEDLKKIADHLIKTHKKSNGQNAMWKAFGVANMASSPEPSSIEEKLDFLIHRSESALVPVKSFMRQLSPHIVRVLRNAAIDSLGQIARRSEDELSMLVGIGTKELNEIKSVLADYDLSLGMK